jgi:hypothetical protein
VEVNNVKLSSMFGIHNAKVKFDFVKESENVGGISDRSTSGELQDDSGCLADAGA